MSIRNSKFDIVFAWEGAVAVAKPQDHSRVGSHRFLTCVPKDGVATSAFLHFHFLTDRGLEQLGKASPGGAGRNRTLGLKALDEITVPLPAFETQRWFDSLEAKVDSLKRLQAETGAELDAVLPSILDQMVLNLEERGLIARVPAEPRSIRVLLPRQDLPDLE